MDHACCLSGINGLNADPSRDLSFEGVGKVRSGGGISSLIMSRVRACGRSQGRDETPADLSVCGRSQMRRRPIHRRL